MNLFFCILLSVLTSVLCSKNDMLKFQHESWISNKDFETIIKLSLPSTNCCNVFFDDSEWRLEVLFRQFRSVYPNGHLLQQHSLECHGYFFIGSSDNDIIKLYKNLPPFLWKSEILLIVDDNISNKSTIFNGSLYDLANVNIVSLSGIWKLSNDYIIPRSFHKLDRYENLSHTYKQGYINLRGKELYVSSVYQPPMTYVNRTINKTRNGELIEVFTMNSDIERDGIEMQLFFIMAETLNFTWTIIKPSDNFAYGTRINETAWKGGMIQLLREKKVDIAFGSIWVTLDQSTFVHLSEPWYELRVHFLVPRPRRTTSFWALGRPFSNEIWFLLISSLIVHSLCMCARAWIDPKFPQRFRNLPITITYIIGYFLSSSVPRNISNVKLHSLLWQTAGWLIITAYCSSLAARLSSSEYENRIDTVQQFLAANLTWGRSGQTPPFKDYFDLTNPYSSRLPSRYRHIDDNAQVNRFVRQDNFAIPGKIVGSYFFPDDFIENEDLKNYRLMKEPVGRFYAAYGVQPWLLEPLNRIILWLKESGITFWHLRNVIRRRNSYNLREVLVEHDKYDGNVQVLGLTPLGIGFSLLAAGSFLATIVLLLEIKRAAATIYVREV